MKKIGFVGGCFNPITNIHIEIANKLIESKKLDKVIFVPVNDYYKKQKLVSSYHRYNMIKLAVNSNKNLDVDDFELKENRNLFAKDAFELIDKKYNHLTENNDLLYMIMGSDNYINMPKWKDYNIIKNKYNFIVIDRDENDISSTKIREMIKNNNVDVKEYLPEEVYKYIRENKLYEEN